MSAATITQLRPAPANAQDVAIASGMAEAWKYPATFDDFVGQELAKEMLQLAAASARMRETPCGHILLASGTAGIGKTSLALLVAAELQCPVKTVSGKVKLADAKRLLLSMKDGSVLFWDEIHMAVQGGKADAEWLLHYLQDGVLMTPRGALKVPRVTIIGATTDVGRLPATIVSRFPIQPVLQPYNEEEALHIALGMSAALFGDYSDQPPAADLDLVVTASHRQPRRIRALLEKMRDLKLVRGSYDMDKALELAGLTADGLTDLAQRYITTLFNSDAPMGAMALGDALGEKGNLHATEEELRDMGLICFTKQGRDLTADGMHRAADLINGE